MKKFIFTLFAFVTIVQATWAQSFYYDIWFDSRRDAMLHGTFTPGENELTLDLSAITSAGLHFLNITPYYEWGERGVWKCIPFYMPEGWPHTTDAKWVEYWVTAYDSEPKRIEYTGTEIPLDIDISQMSYGLHFLNVRTFNEVGEAGPWKQIMFYVSNGICDPEFMGYEYWIDDREPVKGDGYFPSVIPIDIDINAEDLTRLEPGTHTFNFRAMNLFHSYGETFSVQFEVEPHVTVTANSYSRTYGEENPTLEYTVEGGTLKGEPEIICEATKDSSVGEYPILISKGNVTNYDDSYVNGTLTIEKALLTVTAKDYTVKQGDALPAFEITYTGFKNSEMEDVIKKKPTISCDATSWSAVGMYDIIISGAEAENYDFLYVKGTLTITDPDSHSLTYIVDGEVYKTYQLKYGDAITPEEEPTKDGYIFSGWSEIPATMPAHDVTVTGTFTLDTGIEEIMSNANGDVMIFTIDGKRVDNLKKGMNIIRMSDGTTRKVVVK